MNFNHPKRIALGIKEFNMHRQFKKILSAVLIFSSLSSTLLLAVDKSKVLWPSGEGIYNYCPTTIIENGNKYYWWCQNKDPYKVFDYIYFREIKADGTLTDSKCVLSPGMEGEWDSYHVCDPAIIKGEFSYNDNFYNYALFYLGTDKIDCTNNQIGVAFSKNIEGPWTKYSGNPIVKSPSRNVWGVGQPSVTSIDSKGEMLLFYTKGDETGTHIFRRKINISDLKDPIIGDTLQIPETGLQSGDGSPVVLHNGDFAYSPDTDTFYIVRPRHPFDEEVPNFVSSTLQIAEINGNDIWLGKGDWTVLGTIGKENSNFPRNHNACIVTNPYGFVEDNKNLTIDFTTGVLGDSWLWSYTINEININLTDR